MPYFSHLDPSKRDFKGEVQKLGFTEKQQYDLDLKDINDVGFKDDNVDLAVSDNIKGTGVGDITRRTHPCNHQFQGEVMEHPSRMLMCISSYCYNYTMEEKRTPQHEINHIVSYYAYFGFVRSDNPLQFSQQFFGYDGNGRPIRSTFHRDTTIEVNEDVGDFSDDGDLTLSEITFYQDVYGE
ncbi:hypothetical protein JHK86_042723 [Glycine max]|nr:hypothetical protein JHK86_042723 [Glycine max]